MKFLHPYRSVLKYLIWPGLALVTAGLVAGSIGGWTVLPWSLLGVGVVLLGLGLVSSGSFSRQFWQQRSTQAGTNAVVATAAVAVILLLVNLVAVRYGPRLDLTENQLFTLAPQTVQVVSDLPQPVRVVIFDLGIDPADRRLLENYQRQNPGQFSYEYVDPFERPQLAQAFGSQGQGDVFLEVGEQRQRVQQVNPQERLSESRLTSQLDRIASDRNLTAYYLEGHGQYAIDGSQAGFNEAVASLEAQEYRVEGLNFVETPEIPEDADLVIVAGPQQEFFEAEVEALRTYLDQGGSALLLLDPNADPGLDDLLAEWGLFLDDRLVIDTSGSGQIIGMGPAAPLVTRYGDHPITQELGGGRSFYPVVQPIDVSEVPNVTATPLLFSNEQSRAGRLSPEGDLEFDPDQSPVGPFVLGVALSRPVSETAAVNGAITNGDENGDEVALEDPEAAAETDPETPDDPEPEAELEPEDAPAVEADNADPDAIPETRLVVVGNSSFASDGLFDQQLNSDVFLNAVTWLGQQDDAILSIRPREATARRVLLTPTQQLALSLVALLGLPLVGFAGAGVMWWRRR